MFWRRVHAIELTRNGNEILLLTVKQLKTPFSDSYFYVDIRRYDRGTYQLEAKDRGIAFTAEEFGHFIPVIKESISCSFHEMGRKIEIKQLNNGLKLSLAHGPDVHSIYLNEIEFKSLILALEEAGNYLNSLKHKNKLSLDFDAYTLELWILLKYGKQERV